MSCENLDRDQTFTVHDFGPSGHVGNVTVNLTQSLQPGSTISAVVRSDQEFNFNIFDGYKNCLLHCAARVAENELALNSRLEDKWGKEEVPPRNPFVKGVRASIFVLYESDGYRIFVNGEALIFYKHRSNARPDHMEIINGQVFKLIYHTNMNVIP